MKKILIPVIIIATSLLSGCGEEPMQLEALKGDEAKNAFEKTNIVTIRSDADNVDISSPVIIGNKSAGYLQESGFFDISFTYSIDDADQFYLKYVTDEPINANEPYVTASTYGYYDMDGKCFGYAQQRELGTDQDVDHGYEFAFMNADGTMKDYYVQNNAAFPYDWTQEGASIMSMDGEKVGEVLLVMDDYYYNEYSVTLKLYESLPSDALSAADKTAILWRAAYFMNQRYYDPSDD